ncbi:hypothetical protein CANDROIZ_370010 [Candidatus Roizmanbacteria bacterium]|nr:hypothetical protein CANDROIZ_370010 [Candidatus Roizmanbacteria bacterium]
MRIAIFSESLRFDQTAYEILISRILKEFFNIKKVQLLRLENVSFNGKADVIKQSPLAAEQLFYKHKKLKIIFVFADADGEFPQATNETESLIKKEFESFLFKHSVLFAVGVPTRNIEAWLLADIGVIIKITKIKTLNQFINSEKIKNPKDKFSEIYAKYRKVFSDSEFLPLSKQELANKIFLEINLDLLQKRSLSFKRFITELKINITS